MAQVKSLKTGIKFKDTPIGKIPVDWETVQLGDISEAITKGTTPTTYGHDYKEKGISFLRVENITENGKINLNDIKYISPETHEFLNRSKLEEGDILFSIAGAIGRCALVTSDILPANINQAIALIRIKEKRQINLKFLLQMLLSKYIRNQAASEATSLAQTNLNLEQVKKLSLPLPSLPTQKKIAEILTTVDDGIEETDRIIEKTKELKKGLMQQLLTRGIGHKKFKKTEIGEIPQEWEVMRLKEAVKEFYNGGTPDTKVKEYWDGDIPWATGADFLNKRIGQIRRYITIEGVKNSSTNVIPKGNLLVVTRTGVGKLAIAPFDIAISQDITGVITDDKKLLPDFLYRFFDYHEKKLKSFVQGTSINGLLREDLALISICIPKLKEQKEITNILSDVDSEIDNEEIYKQNLETLKKSLMQVLLTGKVRVKLY